MPLRNRKQSANTHDKRHEDGLAPPISKKSSKLKQDALDTNDADTQSHLPELGNTGDVLESDESDRQSSPDVPADGNSLARPMDGSARMDSDTINEPAWEGSADVTADEQESTVATPSVVLNGNASRLDKTVVGVSGDFAATIISPQPLRDVLALLLLLLQLPPTILTIIQICFAVMTLGQPLSALSYTTIPTWHDWFHSHGGNPSIVTTLFSDLAFMTIWFMTTSVLPASRDITLDLAQSVIAMSLGGGTVSRGGWNYCLACVSIVAIPHALRSELWHDYAASPLAALARKFEISMLADVSAVVSCISTRYHRHSWPRMILELHILTQGAVRVIRRWIDRQPGTASVKRVDPEAAAASFNLATAASNNPGIEGLRVTSSDNRPPGPSPAAREAKEKNVSSGKKRRKQGNFVRSQQPFWAAIASSKVTVTKETEHTQDTKDMIDAEAAESLRRKIADGKQGGLGVTVWVNSVDHTEVAFTAIVSDDGPADESNGRLNAEHSALYARINGARWNQLEYKDVDQITKLRSSQRLVRGRVHGLTPSENFFLEFIDRSDDTVIYSTHLVTKPMTVSEAGTATPAALPIQPQDSLRPSSPITTFKKAIAAAEHQLSDVRARSKKTRKDHKSSNANLKREVDALENRLSTSSGADERQRQRQAQFRQSIRLAEDSVASINQQIDELAEIPEAEQDDYDTMHRTWQQALSQRNAAREELDKVKADAEQRIAALAAEQANLRQKIEKAESRLLNHEQKREHLQASTTQARREKSRWDAQRAAIVATWQSKEREFIGAIQYLESQRQDIENRIGQLQQQSYFLESSLANGQSTVMHTPESSFSALNLGNHRGSAFSSMLYSSANTSSPLHSRQNSTRQHPRGRSSSMLSAISGFTEDETGVGASIDERFADPAPTHVAASEQAITRNASTGSGSVGNHRSPGPTPKMSPVVPQTFGGSASPRGGGAGPGAGMYSSVA